MGSVANLYRFCVALSFIVGIDRGLSSPFRLGMYILFNGRGVYPRRLRLKAALYLSLWEVHKTLSMPGVCFPLLDVTAFTANIFAECECISK